MQPDRRGVPEPFQQLLSDLSSLVPGELGPSLTYTPQRLALATLAPQPGDLQPNIAPWPLAGTLADFGQPWGAQGSRCAMVEGADLDALLGALQSANQLTIFVDSATEQRSLLARALVPLELSPCGDEG